MEDVITLSSDEEQYFDGPPTKKSKFSVNFAHNLNDLSSKNGDNELKTLNKPTDDVLTIIIRDNDPPQSCINNGHGSSFFDLTTESKGDFQEKLITEQIHKFNDGSKKIGDDKLKTLNKSTTDVLTIVIRDKEPSQNGINKINGDDHTVLSVTTESKRDVQEKLIIEQTTTSDDNSVSVVIEDASDAECDSRIEVVIKKSEKLELNVNSNDIEEHLSLKDTKIINLEENSENHIMSDLRSEETAEPSTSKSTAFGSSDLLDQFIIICDRHFKTSRFATKLEKKITQMRENFTKCNGIHQDFNFKKMLLQEISAAEKSAPCAVHSFQRIYTYLMDHVVGQTIEVEEDDLPKIKKLDKAMRLIMKKIKELEEEEINFSDEEDSSFIKLDRYTQRLNKIHVKYCELIKRNPHAGRILYDKIQFVSSKYNEINYAVTKMVKRNKFPTYYDVEKCVQKCVTECKLSLSETEIKEESRFCFKRIGDLMQSRRKKELYEAHSASVPLNEDPALKDPELNKKLKISFEEGEQRLKKVIDAFAKKQENNIMAEGIDGSDSDDSNHRSSSGSDSERGGS